MAAKIQDGYSGLVIGLICWLLYSSLGMSQESRTWTDIKGRTLKGAFIKLEGKAAVIRLANGKVVPIQLTLLSEADVAYAKSQKPAPTPNKLSDPGQTPERSTNRGGPVDVPEKEVRLRLKINERDAPFIIPDTEVTFDVYESDHFLVMTDGKFKPKALLETAERMWHGASEHHPNFSKRWGKKKLGILLPEDEDLYKELGKWYMEYLNANEMREASLQAAILD